MKIVYLVPAPDMDERTIAAIQLEGCHVVPVKLPAIDRKTNLVDYIQALNQQIQHPKPVLLGACYGGPLAIELAKIRPVEKVVIVSSVKSRHEVAWSRRAIGRIYLLIPNLAIASMGKGLAFLINDVLRVKVKIPRIWRKSAQNRFIVRHLLSFESATDVLHVHGRYDKTFPLRAISQVDEIVDAGHFMLDTKRRATLAALERAVHRTT